ncbi:hypothetical protein TWF281_002327 [Arthrobotrys megalospora]
MLQRLSRESLRVISPQDSRANGPIIYETSKQVKKAYSKRKGTLISEAEKKRIERIRVLDERAEKIRQKEQRKKENALKRKAKEEKEGPTYKKIARITSSQPELGKFFVAKKGQSAPVKREHDYSVDVPQEHSEAEDVRPVDLEPSEDEDEEGDVAVEAETKPDILIEKPIDDSDASAISPTLVGEQGNENFVIGQKATMKHCPQPSLSEHVNSPGPLDVGPSAACALLDDTDFISNPNEDLPSTLPRGVPESSPPQPIYAQDPLSELAEEKAEAIREENERILETLREETDYNDFDDDYDLDADPGFDYDYAEGPTSPVHEVEYETHDNEGLDLTSSHEAYGMGLSDSAFDELHDAFEHEVEEAHAEESEHELGSSFLCQAFEDDLRELEEGF